MQKKIRVAIIFGGKSAEHEVSLRSAQSIFENLDKDKYEPVLIGIDKQGKWLLANEALAISDKQAVLLPAGHGEIVSLNNDNTINSIDVAFPVLHGPFGEDGTIQGLLKLANIPFVGADVLGSAIGMDKDVMKRLLRDAGIPIAKFDSYKHYNLPTYEQITNQFGSPIFVKPANLGSSVGVSKAKTEEEFNKAVTLAFKYDTKIIIEEYIQGREIECSVLGNDHPSASLPGEIIPTHEFYSYDAKYTDEQGAKLEIPAKLTKEQIQKIQNTAIKTFEVLCCNGLARVDFFLKDNGDIYVNEINTMPGFTAVSMYPKLWEASGIRNSELVDKIIELALEKFKTEQKLLNNYK